MRTRRLFLETRDQTCLRDRRSLDGNLLNFVIAIGRRETSRSAKTVARATANPTVKVLLKALASTGVLGSVRCARRQKFNLVARGRLH